MILLYIMQYKCNFSTTIETIFPLISGELLDRFWIRFLYFLYIAKLLSLHKYIFL